MNHIYISVVSHGHEKFIMNNSNLIKINEIDNVTVLIKDNILNEELKEHCAKFSFKYVAERPNSGFGENNNIVFSSALELGLSNSDWFFIINPDANIELEQFILLTKEIEKTKNKLFTVSLFKDAGYLEHEHSLRNFPKWIDVLNLFLNKPVNKAYDKVNLDNFSYIDWASGAFLIFKGSLYTELGGFDKKYFMYYEDVDICYRARNKFDQKVCFIKSVSAVHDGAYANRNIFSKHFYWYLTSLFKFLVSKRL